MGYRNVRVVPPVVDLRHLASLTPRASTMNHLRSLNAPIVLSVAQLMPHKRPDFLVEAMHIAETYLEMGRPVLMLVGHHRLEHFTRAIREQVRELNLSTRTSSDRSTTPISSRCSRFGVGGRDRERARRLLPAAHGGDVVRQAGHRACVRGDPGNRRRRRRCWCPRSKARRSWRRRSPNCCANPPLAAESGRRGRGAVEDYEAAPPDATVVEALLEVV